ncbi:MAG: hypothetical protein ABI230_13245 [Aestuariivirga sp.]
MAIYGIYNGSAKVLQDTSFEREGILERRDLQKIIRESISVLLPDAMVLDEEFGNWDDSKRRIDLLCLRSNANLVVVELKRTEDGGHMDLQALRYAAMISKMRFQQAVEAHQSFLKRQDISGDAEQIILDFLGWDEPLAEKFSPQVSIVLAAAEFSKELTTAVMWLNEFDLDITCIRLRPFRHDQKLLLNVEQIIPIPEASDYQVSIREKVREERIAREQNRDLTRFNLRIGNNSYPSLPKRKLAYHIIREAVLRGASPIEVFRSGRGWVVVDGEKDEVEFKTMAISNRDERSSTSDVERFFTGNEELFFFDGRTYALTKMWGTKTLETVDEIISRYKMAHINYAPMP